MKGINWLIISLWFEAKDNIYALKTNGIYKCLVNKNEFKKIGGIYLSQSDNFIIYLLFSKNNVYDLTTEYNDYHNKNNGRLSKIRNKWIHYSLIIMLDKK